MKFLSAPSGTVRSRTENQLQQLAAPVIPADSGVRGNQRRRQRNQVDELKYKIAGLTCQLLLPEE